MVAHPELKNIRIQAADLDYALREKCGLLGKKRAVTLGASISRE